MKKNEKISKKPAIRNNFQEIHHEFLWRKNMAYDIAFDDQGKALIIAKKGLSFCWEYWRNPCFFLHTILMGMGNIQDLIVKWMIWTYCNFIVVILIIMLMFFGIMNIKARIWFFRNFSTMEIRNCCYNFFELQAFYINFLEIHRKKKKNKEKIKKTWKIQKKPNCGVSMDLILKTLVSLLIKLHK